MTKLIGFELPNPTRLTADGAVSGNPCIIWAVQLNGGTAACKAEFTNDADGSGTNVIEVCAPHTDADGSAQSSVFVDYSKFGGIKFSSKCFLDITGTGAVCFVWTTDQ